MKIGEKIKSLRNSKGMSTYDLAKITGISQSTISKLENGKRKGDLDIIKTLANALDIPLSGLIDGEHIAIEEMNHIENLAPKCHEPYKPVLTIKDQEKLNSQAKEIIDEFAMHLAQDKECLEDEDYRVLQASINSALQTIKLKNKEKYNPNKNK